MDYKKYKRLLRAAGKGTMSFSEQLELMRAAERGEIDPSVLFRRGYKSQIEPTEKEFFIYRSGTGFHMGKKLSHFHTLPPLNGHSEGVGPVELIADIFGDSGLEAGYTPVIFREKQRIPYRDGDVTAYPIDPEDEKYLRERFGDRVKIR